MSKALRQQLAVDPFMSHCIYGCLNKPEWEHAFTYGGKQINEHWAIVPVCYFHHRGAGLDKNFNRYIALRRASIEDFKKYPKVNWFQILEHLERKFYNYPLPKGLK